jgi:hypothetical protein
LLVPVTVAMYCDVVPGATLVAPLSVNVTVGDVLGGGVASATGRLCETEGLATLVAVIIIFEDCGAAIGAV